MREGTLAPQLQVGVLQELFMSAHACMFHVLVSPMHSFVTTSLSGKRQATLQGTNRDRHGPFMLW